jgi:hypothetical protein
VTAEAEAEAEAATASDCVGKLEAAAVSVVEASASTAVEVLRALRRVDRCIVGGGVCSGVITRKIVMIEAENETRERSETVSDREQ